MPQIPEEAILSTRAGRMCSTVTFPAMSKEAAKKFCDQQGWMFKDNSGRTKYKFFNGIDPKSSEVMLSITDETATFFSR